MTTQNTIYKKYGVSIQILSLVFIQNYKICDAIKQDKSEVAHHILVF